MHRYRLPDDSVRVAMPPSFYDEVLDANPGITLGTVQSVAEEIAGPICQRFKVPGVRWDEQKAKFVFSRASEAKVVKDRWAGGLRSALTRRAAEPDARVIDRLADVEAAVRLAFRDGLSEAEILAATERGLRSAR